MTDLHEKLATCCKKLRLSSNLADMAMKTEGATHQEYLCELLKKEIDNRWNTRIGKLMNTAGFPITPSFGSFRFDEVKLPVDMTEQNIKTLDFYDEHKNIIMYGGTGTGKTMLSICIGITACNRGIPVRFYRTAGLINQLSEYKEKGCLSTLTKKLDKAAILILDEFGYIPYDRTGSMLLFDYLSETEHKKCIILNTNKEFSQWVNVLYDAQMTSALIGRLTHNCHMLLFPGENNRLKESSINELYHRIAEEKNGGTKK